jgi:hypothetical protein
MARNKNRSKYAKRSIHRANEEEYMQLNSHFYHEGHTMRKIMENKPQVSSAIIAHRPLQISWNDLLHQDKTADISIIRSKTGTLSIETLYVHLAP